MTWGKNVGRIQRKTLMLEYQEQTEVFMSSGSALRPTVSHLDKELSPKSPRCMKGIWVCVTRPSDSSWGSAPQTQSIWLLHCIHQVWSLSVPEPEECRDERNISVTPDSGFWHFYLGNISVNLIILFLWIIEVCSLNLRSWMSGNVSNVVYTDIPIK